MARNRKQRRQQHGSAWHWKQTDCWYYAEPGTKKRVALFDEKGERIRGKDGKEAARVALARIKLAEELGPPAASASSEWTVAKVCDLYLTDLHRSASPAWAVQVDKWLNDLCGYCGGLTVTELKKKHLRNWLQRHTTWNHNTQRNVIASVIAAFNFCCKFDDLSVNPIAGYEKPTATPRVTAFSPEEEAALYEGPRGHRNYASSSHVAASKDGRWRLTRCNYRAILWDMSQLGRRPHCQQIADSFARRLAFWLRESPANSTTQISLQSRLVWVHWGAQKDLPFSFGRVVGHFVSQPSVEVGACHAAPPRERLPSSPSRTATSKSAPCSLGDARAAPPVGG